MRNPYDIYLLWVFVVVYMKVKRLDFCLKKMQVRKNAGCLGMAPENIGNYGNIQSNII